MVKLIVGTMGSSPFSLSPALSSSTAYEAFLSLCHNHGITELDTARTYQQGRNEGWLKEAGVGRVDWGFQIGTKIDPAGEKGSTLTGEAVRRNIEESLQTLNVGKVDVFYIHMPDRKVPIEETCEAIDQVYREGKFERFGICSYKVEEVQEIWELCDRKGWVKPSVYQGNFNAIARAPVEKLFPTLKKLGIAFYGFGPLAGGVLARPARSAIEEGARFAALPFLKTRYGTEQVLDALDALYKECEKQGMSIAQASYAWIKFHATLGDEDGVIAGASSVEQLEKNLQLWEAARPLSAELLKAYEELGEATGGKEMPYYVA